MSVKLIYTSPWDTSVLSFDRVVCNWKTYIFTSPCAMMIMLWIYCSVLVDPKRDRSIHVHFTIVLFFSTFDIIIILLMQLKQNYWVNCHLYYAIIWWHFTQFILLISVFCILFLRSSKTWVKAQFALNPLQFLSCAFYLSGALQYVKAINTLVTNIAHDFCSR